MLSLQTSPCGQYLAVSYHVLPPPGYKNLRTVPFPSLDIFLTPANGSRSYDGANGNSLVYVCSIDRTGIKSEQVTFADLSETNTIIPVCTSFMRTTGAGTDTERNLVAVLWSDQVTTIQCI